MSKQIVKRWLGITLKGTSVPSLLARLAKDFNVPSFTNYRHVERNGHDMLYVEYLKEGV